MYERWFNFRVFMNKVVDHKIFEIIILLSIGISSITLVCIGPHEYFQYVYV